jgi:2'-5' RNA ligase
MRLFVAIWVPQEVLEGLPLALLQENLTRQGVRFTKPEKIHLTLRYIGLVDSAEPVASALSEALTGMPPVELTTAALGAFPHLERPKVIWAGVQGALDVLRARVIEATDDFAEKEAEEHVPHLTLARVSPPSSKVGRALAPLVQQTADELFGRWTANEVQLVETKGDGSYSIVAEFPLVAEEVSG